MSNSKEIEFYTEEKSDNDKYKSIIRKVGNPCGKKFCEKCNAPIVETMCCCDCKIYDAMRR